MLRQFFFTDSTGSVKIGDSESRGSLDTRQSVQLEIDSGIATITLWRRSDVGTARLARLARELETSFVDRAVSATLREYRASISRSVMMQRYLILRDDDTVAKIVLESERMGHPASESDEWVSSSSEIESASSSSAIITEAYANFRGVQTAEGSSVQLLIDGVVEVLPMSDELIEHVASFVMNEKAWVRIVNIPIRRIADLRAADSVKDRTRTEPDITELFERWSGVMERLA